MTQTVLFLEPKGTVLEVVRAAKNRGFRVVAMNSDSSLLTDASEPYKSVVSLIDKVIPIKSWENHEDIISLTEEEHRSSQIVGIYTGVDPCVAITARLRQIYHLPTSSPKKLKVVLDKFFLRKRLQETGLSRIKNVHSSRANRWKKWEFDGPAYFKPVHGFFSAYVKRCESYNDFMAAKSAWSERSSHDSPFVRNYILSKPEYHLEEAFDGELLSVEGAVVNRRFQVLGLTSRILYSKDPVVEMGSCFPYSHPLSEKIIDLVCRAHRVLGLDHIVTHTEVIVSPKGDVEIIDLNPRFVGADVLQSINFALNTKFEETLLDFSLGKQIKLNTKNVGVSCLQYLLPPPVATFESVQFPERPEVKFNTAFLKPGSQINSSNRQLDYLGCYLTFMPTMSEALTRSRELRGDIRVNGTYQGDY